MIYFFIVVATAVVSYIVYKNTSSKSAIEEEIQDYIMAMTNEEAKAKAGVNVIETDI